VPWPTAGSEDALAVSCTRQGRGKRRRAEHGHAVKQRESLPVTIEAESGCTPRNLGPLVLVNPILERMDIRRLVDLHCPADPRLQIPTGDVIHLLAANRLSSKEQIRTHVARPSGPNEHTA